VPPAPLAEVFGDDRVNLVPRDDVIDESVARLVDLGVEHTFVTMNAESAPGPPRPIPR
jgi:hypothetical protein